MTKKKKMKDDKLIIWRGEIIHYKGMPFKLRGNARVYGKMNNLRIAEQIKNTDEPNENSK